MTHSKIWIWLFTFWCLQMEDAIYETWKFIWKYFIGCSNKVLYIFERKIFFLERYTVIFQSQRYQSIYIFYVPCSHRIIIIAFSSLNTTWVLEVTIESFYVLDFPWIFKDFCVSTSLFLSLTSSRFMLDSYPWKLYH